MKPPLLKLLGVSAIALFFLSSHTVSVAQPYPEPTTKAPAQEFGRSIDDSPYRGFWKSWNLVTARYRSDADELRFTYANKIAADAIRAGKKDFPDGAVFGKTSWYAESDPLFTSSVQPSRVRRFQIMVKDSRKYAATRGWGYEIYTSDGRQILSNFDKTVQACAACHEYAAERGYVFLGNMDPKAAPSIPSPHTAGDAPLAAKDVGDLGRILGQIDVASVARENVPPSVARHLPPGTSNVSRIAQRLSENSFVGTTDELMPALLRAAAETSRPAAFWSSDGQRWSVAYKDLTTGRCRTPGGRSGFTYATRRVVATQDGSTMFREKLVCQ